MTQRTNVSLHEVDERQSTAPLPELAASFGRNPPAPGRKRYLAFPERAAPGSTGLSPVAFVALDVGPGWLFLYEIYVIRQCRKQGIGTAILHKLKAFAVQHQRSSIFVRPSPLDPTDDNPEWLKSWYTAQGFNPCNSDNLGGGTVLELIVAPS